MKRRKTKRRARPEIGQEGLSIERFGPLLILGTFLAMVIWTWRKWPDALVDFGRELYVPWQLVNGKSLYTDIAYFNGPLSPWFNSVMFDLFGVSFLALALVNLLILSAISAMIYVLVLRVSRPATATVATIVFLTVFAFGQYLGQGNYNFVAPYSHEMTHGTGLALVALLCLASYLRRGDLASLFVTGLAMGLTFLTKAEFFIAITAAVTVSLIARFVHEHATPRDILRSAGALGAGLVLPPAVVFLLLLRTLNPAQAFTGVQGPWAYIFMKELSQNKLYRDILGLSDISENLRIIARWSLWYLGFLLPAVGLSFLVPRAASWSRWLILGLIPTGALAVLAFRHSADWEYFAKPFPVAMMLITVSVVSLQWRSRNTTGNRDKSILMLAMVVYATVLLIKIFLNVRFVHYGFALAMPAAVVMTVVLIDVIPHTIERRGGNAAIFRAAALGCLVGVVGWHLYATHTWHRLRTVRVGTGNDAFLTDARGAVLNDVLGKLATVSTPDQTLAVIPEGVMINYLARLTNPTPFINFMPPEFIMFEEDRMIEAFQADPPDWIVLTDRHVPEYGYDLIGTDYGLKLMFWVQDHYEFADKVVDEQAVREQLRYAVFLRRAGASEPLPARDDR